jgi:hypothetical protein
MYANLIITTKARPLMCRGSAVVVVKERFHQQKRARTSGNCVFYKLDGMGRIYSEGVLGWTDLLGGGAWLDGGRTTPRNPTPSSGLLYVNVKEIRLLGRWGGGYLVGRIY